MDARSAPSAKMGRAAGAPDPSGRMGPLTGMLPFMQLWAVFRSAHASRPGSGAGPVPLPPPALVPRSPRFTWTGPVGSADPATTFGQPVTELPAPLHGRRAPPLAKSTAGAHASGWGAQAAPGEPGNLTGPPGDTASGSGWFVAQRWGVSPLPQPNHSAEARGKPNGSGTRRTGTFGWGRYFCDGRFRRSQTKGRLPCGDRTPVPRPKVHDTKGPGHTHDVPMR